MELKSEPDDKADVTVNNENLSTFGNDKDGKDENGCEKDTNDAAEATETTELEEKEIKTDNHFDHQDDTNDMVDIKTESAETEDTNITIGAMNTQIRKKRKRRKAHESSVNKDSEPNKVTNPVNTLKRKRSRRTKYAENKLKKLIKSDSLDADPISKEVEVEPSVDLPTDSMDDVEYCLTVSNLPVSWSFMEIKNYFDTEVGPVDEIEMIKDDKTGFGAIRLSYQTEKECNDSKQKLQGKVVAGNKLALEMAAVSSETDTEMNSETTDASTKLWKPDMDSWEVDLNGMYGLRLPFLKSLGITPPLDKWVHVSNFRCDKSELRDILELAGHVQMCSVFTISNRYANVMYSHPLEAVQAVSMLNNQIFYGQTLKVAMDRSPANTVLLPKGLSAIGSGLGLNGKPLRNIVKHYERFLESKECFVNPIAFNVPEDHSVKNLDVKFEVKSVEDFNYPIVNDIKVPPPPSTVKTVIAPKPPQTPSPKPKVQTPAYTKTPVTKESREVTPYTTFVAPQTNNGNFRPQGIPNLMSTPVQPPRQSVPFLGPPRPMGQGPMGPGPMVQGPMGPVPMGQGPIGPRPMGQGPMGPRPMGPRPMGPRPMGPGPMGPRQMGPGPMGPGPMGPRPMGPGPMGPRPMGPMRPVGSFDNEPVKMVLSNLPPSTTFPLLCEKMSQWGHVVCLQLTTPGCAVVTFGNRMQADACFPEHFNGRSIENHIIQMQYA